MEVLQLEWVTQLRHMMECYNANVEDDEDPWNINIPKIEGCSEVQGQLIEDPDITAPPKVR